MVAKKTSGRGSAERLRLKKETLRDLDPKGGGKKVKAGKGGGTGDSCGPYCSLGCERTFAFCKTI